MELVAHQWGDANMKQYCRYCVYLCVNNAPYCDKRKEFRKESSCKRPNNCKDFKFAECEPEYQDAFFETNGYRPRGPKKKQQIDGQISFEFEKGGDLR